MIQLVVNSLGELIRQNVENGKYREADNGYNSGCMSVSHVAKSVLTTEQHKVWSTFQGDEADALNRYVSECCNHKFVTDAFEEMPLPVFDFYQRVTNLQTLNEGRFRVYGRKMGESFDAEEKIILVTEFQHWMDDEAFWEHVNQVAAENDCEINVMHEDKHLDHSWRTDDDGNKIDERYGENHGRMERQVEFYIDITEISKSRHAIFDLLQQIERMTEITKDLWNEAGVGVL